MVYTYEYEHDFFMQGDKVKYVFISQSGDIENKDNNSYVLLPYYVFDKIIKDYLEKKGTDKND